MQRIEEHLDLVRRLARQLLRRLPAQARLDELFADGLIGLQQAIERFDPTRGVPFRKFAARRIRGAMLDGLRERDWLPQTLRRRRTPQGLSIRPPRSLHDSPAQCLLDPNPTAAEQCELRELLDDALATLPRGARIAIQLYYLERLNLKQTGATLGMTPAGACMLMRRAVGQLRKRAA